MPEIKCVLINVSNLSGESSKCHLCLHFCSKHDKLIIDKKVAMCATKAKIYQRLSNLGKNLIVGNFLYP